MQRTRRCDRRARRLPPSGGALGSTAQRSTGRRSTSRAATRHGLAQRARRAARPTQRSAMLGRTSSRICRKLLEPDLLSTRGSWLPCRCDSLGAWASSLSSLGSGFRPLNNRHSQQASGPSLSQAPFAPNWRTQAHQTGSTAGGAQPGHECDEIWRPNSCARAPRRVAQQLSSAV